jgi:hypothetical protein
MNKTLHFFLAVMLLSITPAFAQIPNASFEEWETINFMGKSFNNVKGWTTSNLMSVFNNEQEMVTQTTDAYEGVSAAKFTNKPNRNNMPASANTSSNATFDQVTDKFALNRKVTALKGFYKYDYTAASDSCSIFVTLYKDSTMVGYGEFVSGNKVNVFTEFTANIQVFDDMTPDSASIWIYTSRDGLKEGSELIVDALTFVGSTPTGLSDNNPGRAFKASVYPNPSSGNAVIEFEQTAPGRTQVIVYDILGNAVAEPSAAQSFHAGNNQVKWDTTPHAPGIYLVKIKQQDAEQTIRVTVK